MKHLFLFLFIFTCIYCVAKPTKTAFFHFTFPQKLHSYEAYSVVINGKEIKPQQDTFAIEIHYPDIDTVILTYSDTKHTRFILTRFQPKLKYALIYHPIKNYDFEIFEIGDYDLYKGYASYLENDPEEYMNETLQKKLSEAYSAEPGKLIFKLKNHKDSSIIGASYVSNGFNLAKGVIFKTNNPIQIGETDLYTFVEINMGEGIILKEQDVYEDDRFLKFYIEDKKLFMFNDPVPPIKYIFHNRETLIVTYDCKTKLIHLKLR